MFHVLPKIGPLSLEIPYRLHQLLLDLMKRLQLFKHIFALTFVRGSAPEIFVIQVSSCFGIQIGFALAARHGRQPGTVVIAHATHIVRAVLVLGQHFSLRRKGKPETLLF